jgi:hypothetical protein
MTTEKQIAANRENAKKSTGPQTLNGKRKSRRNAVRHGLTAETVIDVIEEAADYEALAAAINADFRPATNFELELIARLISLLWRLRRATAIESGLLGLEVLRSRRSVPKDRLSVFYNAIPSVTRPIEYEPAVQNAAMAQSCPPVDSRESVRGSAKNRCVARSYLRLATKDGQAFERLNRYETSLWRQTMQIILLLNSTNRRGEDRTARRPNFLRMDSLRGKRMWPPFGS